MRKNLTLSPGIRYEAQTHLTDYNNVGPRFGVTWAPFKSGKTTLRMSAGMFYDWLAANTYEQTLRVDGFRQRELNIQNPSYPVPDLIGTTPPTNRYLLGSSITRAADDTRERGHRPDDHAASPRERDLRRHARPRPVPRAQPQRAGQRRAARRRFANVVEVVSDARSHAQSVSVNGSFSFAAPSPGAPGEALQLAAHVAQRRLLRRQVGEQHGRRVQHPAEQHAGHRMGPGAGRRPASREPGHQHIDAQELQLVPVDSSRARARRYSIRTGYDDNGDLIFNDRPAGYGRNTLRQPGQWTLNGNFSYALSFGKKKIALPPGISITSIRGRTGGLDGRPAA